MPGRTAHIGKEGKLNDEELYFVNRYMVHLNRQRALVECGTRKATEASMRVQSSRMWNRPHVQAEIKRRQDALAEQTQITVGRIIEEYKAIAFCNVRDLYDDEGNLIPVRQLNPSDAAAINEITHDEITVGYGDQARTIGVTKKIKLSSKLAALDSLAKHLGMFTEKVEVTGKDGGPLEMLLHEIGIDPKSRIKPK